MGLLATGVALVAGLAVLAAAILLDRRPYQPGRRNWVPLMILSLALCLLLGRHLLALVL